MDFHTNSVAAALLVLLLASTAADAASRNENAADAPSKRTPFVPARAEVEVPQPEEATVPLNVEEEEQATSALSLCRLMPHMTPAEQRNCEVALSVPNLKGKWDALTAHVVKQIRASAGDEQGLKVPAFLERLNDPELRKDLIQVALGAAGMTATGLMLGNGAVLRQLALMSLYLTALFQLIKSGAHLAARLASDTSDQANVARTDKAARHKLAKLIGFRPENEATRRSMDDQ